MARPVAALPVYRQPLGTQNVLKHLRVCVEVDAAGALSVVARGDFDPRAEPMSLAPHCERRSALRVGR